MKPRMFLNKKLGIVAIIICLLIPLGFAQSHKEALNSIEESQRAIQEMEEAGLSTTRVNDLLFLANSTYRAQLALNKTGGEPDYSQVIERTQEIKKLKKKAFKIKDEIESLGLRIEKLEGKDLDLSKVKESFKEAKEEFHSERYEKAEEKIEETYKEISQARAAYTKLKAYYEATRESLTYFIKKNWEILSISIIILIVFGWIFYREFALYKLRKRKRKLKRRKKVLKNLIKDAQRKYFEKGEMPEEAYNVRTSKYGEMIRDINRQIPVIEEELEKRKSILH